MLKIILLQQCCTLSDPSEEAVRDRLSFQRFCPIPLDRDTPDHASVQQTIDKLGRRRREANRQFVARGLIIKPGLLVDATLIAAAATPPLTGAASTSAIRTRASRWARQDLFRRQD